jgi:hypothetical protein
MEVSHEFQLAIDGSVGAPKKGLRYHGIEPLDCVLVSSLLPCGQGEICGD